jgi:pimeloyl-ACP methyl ester carboxylesterase
VTGGTADVLVVDGLECTVGRVGSGEPCLYLHSEFAETAEHPALSRLADAGYEVVAPVLPGFEAGVVPEWDELSHVVYWLGSLLDRLGLDGPITVVGSGLGGWLAAEIAVWFPRRVKGLVLIGASGLWVDGSPVAELFRGGLAALSPLVLGEGAWLEDLISPHVADLDAKRLHLLRALEATARIAWAPYFHDPKLLGRLVRVQCPTAVVWGVDDRVVPLAHGELYASAIPEATLTLVPDTGHLPLLEQPEAVVAALEALATPA